MASSLNHPHILTVHDVGEFDGRQYLVTEYVDGGTLQGLGERRDARWRQIVELLTGVADGLAAAHDAGILHRDIKPANILLAEERLREAGGFRSREARGDGSVADSREFAGEARPGTA